MKVATRQFKNVYGIPFFNREVHGALKDYNLLVTVDALFDKKFKQPKKGITIVIDGFAKLRSCGIPVMGYTPTHWGSYVRVPMRKADLVDNSITVSQPHYMRKATTPARPTLQLLLEFNDCVKAEDFKALQEKYAKEMKNPKKKKFKWLRRAINSALKPPAEATPKKGETE